MGTMRLVERPRSMSTRRAVVTGWKLDGDERLALLRQHPPRYEVVVADHVTLAVGSAELPAEVIASIIGRADDDRGVEAMVVSVDGTSDRPDGSTFHITWSLSPGRRAVESNDVLKTHGWTKFERAVPITLTPARF